MNTVHFFRESLYAYNIHIYLLKTLVASITATIQTELLAGMNDDLSVKVGHYLWGHGLEGGQGDMRALIDLSLNYAPHEIILRVAICWAGKPPHFFQPVVHQARLQLVMVVHDNGDILMIRTHYLSFFLFVFPSWLKFLPSSRKKIIWFGLGGFLLVHKGFSIAGRVANYAEVFVNIKTVCLHVVLQE